MNININIGSGSINATCNGPEAEHWNYTFHLSYCLKMIIDRCKVKLQLSVPCNTVSLCANRQSLPLLAISRQIGQNGRRLIQLLCDSALNVYRSKCIECVHIHIYKHTRKMLENQMSPLMSGVVRILCLAGRAFEQFNFNINWTKRQWELLERGISCCPDRTQEESRMRELLWSGSFVEDTVSYITNATLSILNTHALYCINNRLLKWWLFSLQSS